MPDSLSFDQRHHNMSAIHSASTHPELTLRHSLWHQGFRFRINDKSLPGRPDIVLPKYRTVIFVHGCFWHGHKNCRYYTVPKTNTEFWVTKVARNRERDQEVWRKLEANGWNVIIVWECQLKKSSFDKTIEQVTADIIRNGDNYQVTQEERRKARELYRRERKGQKEREQLLLKEVQSL